MTKLEQLRAEIEQYKNDKFNCIGVNEVLKIIDKYADAEQEPKTGHWIVHPKGIYAHLVCDKCLSNAPYDCRTNYCPNCGAKMQEDKE